MDCDQWVHTNCALWSNNVSENIEGGLMNFMMAYRDSLASVIEIQFILSKSFHRYVRIARRVERQCIVCFQENANRNITLTVLSWQNALS